MKHIAEQGLDNICKAKQIQKSNPGMSWIEAMKKTKKKKKLANIVGPQIQKRRYEMGLTQEQLAAKCQLHGFDISRGTLSQIEAQLRCVTDSELLVFAEVLNSSTDSLFPSKGLRRRRK